MAAKPVKLADDETLAIEGFVADVQFRLHQIMKAKNISRTELAERLGVRKSRISNIFGHNSNITLETLGRVLHALGEEGTLSTPTADNRLAELSSSAKEPACKVIEKTIPRAAPPDAGFVERNEATVIAPPRPVTGSVHDVMKVLQMRDRSKPFHIRNSNEQVANHDQKSNAA
jgi:transcriptional regulator with XRE-family HTH domain